MLKAVSNILYDLPPTTWDQIQLINTTQLPIGATVKATDLSMHTFVWDGSNWQSLNGGLISIGSSRTQVALSGSISTAFQVAYAITLPANLVGTTGRLMIRPKVSFTASTNQKEVRLLDGGGSTLANALVTSASIVGINGELSATFETQTSFTRVLTNSANNPYAGLLTSTVTIDTGVSRTINLGILISSTSESAIFYGYDAYVERRT